MSFLAPLFLAGGLLIGLPILFHLIRRTTKEVTPFSSLMFLMPTPPRVTKRSRVDNLLLLFLRCLAVVLLAAAFARPLMTWTQRDEAAAGEGARTVLLIDTSASMRRDGVWAAAQEKANALAGGFRPAEAVAIASFDRTPQALVGFEQWSATLPGERAERVRAALSTVQPGWHATALDTALLYAVDLLDRPAEGFRKGGEIVVVTDLQEGSRLTELQGFEWPKEIRVRVETVGGAPGENVSVAWVGDQSGSATTDFSPRLRVTNHSPETSVYQFTLGWSGGASLGAYVPAGQSRVFKIPKASAKGEAIHLTGDAVDFDNAVHVAESPRPRLLVLFAGQDVETKPDGLLYFLKGALGETPREEIEVRRVDPAQPIPEVDLHAAHLLALGREPGPAALAAARRFAESGKIALLPITGATTAAEVGALLGTPVAALSEARVREYAMLSEIDFAHPFFTPFADPRFSDFTKIHFWKHRKLDFTGIDARVIARFDSGDPAMVEVPIGKGRAVLLASSWLPADGQLALSSKFVPMLHAILESSSPRPPQRGQYFVGDTVLLSTNEARTVKRPDGNDVAVPAGGRFAETELPGIYSVVETGGRFAVNLNPEESKLLPLAPERLTVLGVPIFKETASAEVTKEAAAQRQATEIEARQKVWRWLIVAALVVLLLETVLAGRLARVVPSPAGAHT